MQVKVEAVFRMLTAAILAGLAFSPCMDSPYASNLNVQEEQGADTNPEEVGPYWHSQLEAGYVSLAYINQDGVDSLDDSDGYRASWGGWFEDPYRFGVSNLNAGGPYLSLMQTKNEEQRIWAGIGGFDFSFVALGPIRVFVRAGLGVTYRSNDPDHGIGGVFTPGIGSGLRLGDNIQIVTTVERLMYFPSSDTTQFMVEFRWLSKKIWPPIWE